jgi:hypothetical protein
MLQKCGAMKSCQPKNSPTPIFVNLLPELAGFGSKWMNEPAAGVR